MLYDELSVLQPLMYLRCYDTGLDLLHCPALSADKSSFIGTLGADYIAR